MFLILNQDVTFRTWHKPFSLVVNTMKMLQTDYNILGNCYMELLGGNH